MENSEPFGNRRNELGNAYLVHICERLRIKEDYTEFESEIRNAVPQKCILNYTVYWGQNTHILKGASESILQCKQINFCVWLDHLFLSRRFNLYFLR